jgi:hypothetical protein
MTMPEEHVSSGPPGWVRGDAVGWSSLAPAFTWRSSQRHLLELCTHVTDGRWHLCAPPGAGKTLVGLELARQWGGRTLVLSPTTAIRNQWRNALSLFGADPDTFASSTLDQPAQLYSLTYQLLGNPGRAEHDLRAAARRLWLAEVAAEVGEAVAAQRIVSAERDDPQRARSELGRHVKVLRRSLSTGEDVGLNATQLLGPRTSVLIDRIASMRITCLVLDECHHLLDWWALVVKALADRLAETHPLAVIGLTATLPEPGSAQEKENYAGLLGPVDAELHLAAMVAEGGIAPWRDGLRVAELEPAEARFLDTWSESFSEQLDSVLLSEPFIDWAVAQVENASADARERQAWAMNGTDGWDRFWDADPLAAAALARYWAARGMALPVGFEPPEAAGVGGRYTLDDRLLLLDSWLHALDADVPRQVREDARRIVRRHGVSITTSGVRWNRSTADIVCSRSTAKGSAAGEILAMEAAARVDQLRALVVVERDRATSPPAAARSLLGEDAGTAARILAAVCRFGEVAQRGVICVTGSGAWCDVLGAERIQHAINMSAEDDRWVTTRGSDIPAVVELVGRGTTWESAHWLHAARAALEAGAAQTLVATRGLVGEGWNYPGLNVLVDLSEVASTTAMTQLRGRALRIDPDTPDKIASLWDVVIAHPTAHGDWSRFRRRHARWWGPNWDGALVTGARKVHPLAASPVPPSADHHDAINAASAAVMADRDGTAQAWREIDAAGVATSVLRIVSRRRCTQVRTRGGQWRLTGVGSAFVGGGVAAVVTASQMPLMVAVLAFVAVAAGWLTVAARGRTRSQNDTVRVLGEAVAHGLAAVGHRTLRDASISAASTSDGISAAIHGVDDDTAAAWADAFEELLGPLGTPRWLLTNGARAWRVPRAIGSGKDAATAFAEAFHRRIPGTRLLRAGTPEATELTLRAARERPDEIIRSLRWTK